MRHREMKEKIVDYRKKIATLQNLLNQSRTAHKNMIKKKDAKYKRLTGVLWKRAKKMYNVQQAQVSTRARRVLNERVKNVMLAKSNYIDGILAYPYIIKYARTTKIHPRRLCFIIMAAHFDPFKTTDGEAFGFTVKQCRYYVTTLRRLGLMYKYKNMYYKLSNEGLTILKDYQREWNKGMLKFFKNNKMTSSKEESPMLNWRGLFRDEKYEEDLAIRIEKVEKKPKRRRKQNETT